MKAEVTMRAVWFSMVLPLAGCGLSPLAPGLDEAESTTGLTEYGLTASSSLVDFGTVEPGATEFQDLVLTNTSDDILVLAEVLIDGDSAFLLDTITTLPAELEPGSSEILTLSFSPSDELDYSGGLLIQIADVDESFGVELLGSGGTEVDSENPDTDPQLEIDITSIDFGEVETWTENLELVTIQNLGEEDVLIRNLTFTDPSYGYSGDLVPPTVMSSGTSKSFYVVFNPQAEGEYPASLSIETDINDGTTYDVSLYGSAVEPDCTVCTPQIQVNTPSGDDHLMNFLSVYNFPDEQLLSIQNMSDVDLTISDAYIDNDSQGGDFVLSFSPVTLGPWETTSAAVRFTCPELCFEYPNAFSDTNILHIISDASSEPDYQIELWTGF